MSKDIGRRIAAQTLLRDVSVIKRARWKLSRGKGERVGCQLVDARAGLDCIVFVAMVAQSVNYLILDDVEAHGGQGHARHYVTGTKPYCQVAGLVQVVVRIGTWYHITEPNGAQAHEAKVTCI